MILSLVGKYPGVVKCSSSGRVDVLVYIRRCVCVCVCKDNRGCRRHDRLAITRSRLRAISLLELSFPSHILPCIQRVV